MRIQLIGEITDEIKSMQEFDFMHRWLSSIYPDADIFDPAKFYQHNRRGTPQSWNAYVLCRSLTNLSKFNNDSDIVVLVNTNDKFESEELFFCKKWSIPVWLKYENYWKFLSGRFIKPYPVSLVMLGADSL